MVGGLNDPSDFEGWKLIPCSDNAEGGFRLENVALPAARLRSHNDNQIILDSRLVTKSSLFDGGLACLFLQPVKDHLFRLELKPQKTDLIITVSAADKLSLLPPEDARFNDQNTVFYFAEIH